VLSNATSVTTDHKRYESGIEEHGGRLRGADIRGRERNGTAAYLSLRDVMLVGSVPLYICGANSAEY
jgi:hypothetical protein